MAMLIAFSPVGVGCGSDDDGEPSEHQGPEPTPTTSAHSCPQEIESVCERVLTRAADLQRVTQEDLDVFEEFLLTRPVDLLQIAAGTPCPATPLAREWPQNFEATGQGQGPVYPIFAPPGVASLDSPLTHRLGTDYEVNVNWAASPAYLGPFIVRGQRIDRDGSLLVPGDDEYGAHQFFGTLATSSAGNPPEGWRLFRSAIVISGAGCYAFQIDGADFTQLVVFEATSCGPEGDLCPPPGD